MHLYELNNATSNSKSKDSSVEIGCKRRTLDGTSNQSQNHNIYPNYLTEIEVRDQNMSQMINTEIREVNQAYL